VNGPAPQAGGPVRLNQPNRNKARNLKKIDIIYILPENVDTDKRKKSDSGRSLGLKRKNQVFPRVKGRIKALRLRAFGDIV
jgi:hypothetical protein